MEVAELRHMLRRFAFASTPAAERALAQLPAEKAIAALVADAKRAPEPTPPAFRAEYLDEQGAAHDRHACRRGGCRTHCADRVRAPAADYFPKPPLAKPLDVMARGLDLRNACGIRHGGRHAGRAQPPVRPGTPHEGRGVGSGARFASATSAAIAFSAGSCASARSAAGVEANAKRRSM